MNPPEPSNDLTFPFETPFESPPESSEFSLEPSFGPSMPIAASSTSWNCPGRPVIIIPEMLSRPQQEKLFLASQLRQADLLLNTRTLRTKIRISTACNRIRENELKPGWRPSKINKVSGVVDNRAKKGAGRFTQRDVGRRSFPSLRAQFSALSVEDRVQFLSWLFEGALSRCLPPLSGTVATSTADNTKIAESSPSYSAEDTSEEPHFWRKGLPWSAENDSLLMKLKEEENLTAAEVIRRFDKSFPGRSPGSIQVHWSTKLSKRRSLLAKSSANECYLTY